MDIFNHTSYKRFTSEVLDNMGRELRGVRSRLAEALSCQTAYISQVLNKNAHFSNEQAFHAAQFLSLSDKETEYYLTLLQYERAGSQELVNYYERKLAGLRDEAKDLGKRFTDKRSLTTEQQSTYYSSWHYQAIHAYLALTRVLKKEIIAKQFNISLEIVSKVVEFLMDSELIVKEGSGIRLTAKSFHLNNDSPMIAKHHTNWRVRAMESLDRVQKDELHYSSVITLAHEDLPVARSVMVKAIEEIREIVKKTEGEGVYCYNLDLFSI